MLLNRKTERAALDNLLEAVRGGRSGRKVFTKLGISSRSQLASALPRLSGGRTGWAGSPR